MLTYKKKTYLFIKKITWFTKKKPRISDACFYEAHQCEDVTSAFLFKRFNQTTIRIDLRKSEALIFESFKPNTKNEIRKSEKEGINFYADKNVEKFINFYNQFAATKKLEPLTAYRFSVFGEFYLFTFAELGGQVLVSHAYILDPDLEVTRLLYSASLFRSSDHQTNKKLIARSNRFLTYKDIKYFKKEGFIYYDFGGISYETEQLKSISKFKESFGGIKVNTTNYIGYMNHIFNSIKHISRKLRKEI